MTPKEFAHSVPILIERILEERKSDVEYIYVLYLDGHYEKIRLGEKFPATQEFIELFNEL